jgi:prevent-host-death family protein
MYPLPTNIPSSALQRETGTVLKRVFVNGEHLIITSHEFPVAVIMPVADYKALMAQQPEETAAKQ